MGTLNSSQFSNDFTMALSRFLIAFLALGLVAAEEMEFEEGLSADEILNTEFAVEYSDDDRTIDEIIAAAGTTTTSPSSAAGDVTPALDTTIVLTKCPFKPVDALTPELSPTNWATPSVSTTTNADPTVTTT